MGKPDEADVPGHLGENMARGTKKATLKAALKRVERETVERVLQRTGNDVAEAAAILGIVRPSLYRIMKRHGIAPPTQARTKGSFSPRGDRACLVPETASVRDKTRPSTLSE